MREGFRNFNMNLDPLLNFIKFTHLFQQVKRSIYATGEDRLENDAEHSYQMALVAWYLVETEKLDLDMKKVFEYCLAHDLVEAYAGDTPNFGAGSEDKSTKHEREEHAKNAMRTNIPEFGTLHDLIDEYELQDNAESRFVYALDKVIAPLNIYADNGRSWHRNGVTLSAFIANKRPRLQIDPTILEIFDKLVLEITPQEHLFPKL
ncbi:MAG: metal dependent phosphohydrolase, putative hydrolase of superfamily [Patescibacteria group bacterium]|nr:metal dependent phosphohydrolase, putative hydrolase of superfamily [Patescibacteria group bacterium]